MDIASIIKKPLVTEKTMRETVHNRYTFVVDRRATKGQIKEAVEEVFGVSVKKVRTLRQRGEKHQNFNQEPTWGKEIKKAMVELPEGEKLDVYER